MCFSFSFLCFFFCNFVSQDITLCRARIVTGRDENGLERIIQHTFGHNHTRKYPDRKAYKDKCHLMISKVLSLNRNTKKKIQKL